MSKINIGKTGKRDVGFDLDILLRTRLLIQANSGNGKSWLLRLIAERSFGKVQIIIIDPEGEFSTLREKYDYVLVGKGGETPADVRSAGLVAHKLLELNASAVCDIYEMKASDRHNWVKSFLEALIDAPKTLWHPVLVIVDEAHVFCPEKGAGESIASDAMIGLATRGRKRGFCAVFATQRLGKLRKDAAAELTNVLIGGTFIDVDRKRAAEALGIPKSDEHAFMDEMKVIAPGNFWALGRAISTDRVLVNIGGVETTHPEPGSSKVANEPPPAPSKIKALLPKLSDLPQEAEKKARTESELRTEIINLKRQLSTRPTIEVPQVEKVEVPVFQNGEIERLENIAKDLADLGAQFITASRDLFSVAKTRPSIPVFPKRQRAVIENRVMSASAPLTGNLPEGELKILTACGQYPDGVGREQLTILTGYKRSTRDAYIQRLSLKGYVKPSGKTILITEQGFAALGSDFEPLPVGDELRDYWMRKLPEGESRILGVLSAAYPNSVERDYLTERTGYQRSTRDAYLQRLGAKCLVIVSGRNQVVASPELFS